MIIMSGHSRGVAAGATVRVDPDERPEILLQCQLLNIEQHVDEGSIISVSMVPWLALVKAIQRDPHVLFEFAKNPRKFEEFIAAAYAANGWDEVTLTPRSNDGGRDVIAVKRDYCTVRILDQVKAYSPKTLVTHDHVRAMLGVLQTDPNSSKGIITTTSDFQPTIVTSLEFKPFMPHRLDLKNGTQLAEWIKKFANE